MNSKALPGTYIAPVGAENADENTCVRRLTAALECLRLARSEIQDRSRFTNQLLPAYLTGVAALLAWLWKKDSSSLYLPLPLTCLLSFAGAYVTFAYKSNEGMIGALAKYQIEQLGPVLKSVAPDVPLWECVFHGKEHKSVLREVGMLLQTLAVIPVGLSPIFLDMVRMDVQSLSAASRLPVWILLITLPNLCTIYMTIQMMRDRARIKCP